MLRPKWDRRRLATTGRPTWMQSAKSGGTYPQFPTSTSWRSVAAPTVTFILPAFPPTLDRGHFTHRRTFQHGALQTARTYSTSRHPSSLYRHYETLAQLKQSSELSLRCQAIVRGVEKAPLTSKELFEPGGSIDRFWVEDVELFGTAPRLMRRHGIVTLSVFGYLIHKHGTNGGSVLWTMTQPSADDSLMTPPEGLDSLGGMGDTAFSICVD